VSPRALRWRPFTLPLRQPFAAAHGTLADRQGVLVELTDEGGVIGVGEATPIPSFGGGTQADVVALIERHGVALLDPATRVEGAGSAALRCALDVAALDIEGRRAGKPIAALLSEQPLGQVPVNAIIGDGPPEEIAAVGVEAMARGYRVLKLKVGSQSLAADVARVAALRAACPRARIHLDPNGAWDERTAMEAVFEFEPFGIGLIEQPVPASDPEALARVHTRSSILLAADEAMMDPDVVERVLALQAADWVMLKPMVLGGIRPAFEVGQRALALGMRAIATTTFDSSVGIAASLQLALALPGNPSHGLSTGEMLAGDVVARTLVPTLGVMAPPDAPGLGVSVDEAALDRVATAPWSAWLGD